MNNRREFLQKIAALGIGAALPTLSNAKQTTVDLSGLGTVKSMEMHAHEFLIATNWFTPIKFDAGQTTEFPLDILCADEVIRKIGYYTGNFGHYVRFDIEQDWLYVPTYPMANEHEERSEAEALLEDKIELQCRELCLAGGLGAIPDPKTYDSVEQFLSRANMYFRRNASGTSLTGRRARDTICYHKGYAIVPNNAVDNMVMPIREDSHILSWPEYDKYIAYTERGLAILDNRSIFIGKINNPSGKMLPIRV
jgi:hypothetical protein